MKIFEITKKEVIELVDGLDEIKDQQTLSKIYNSGKYAEIKTGLDNVSKTTLGNLDQKQIQSFNNIFLLHGLDGSFADIQQYFQLLATDRFGSDKLKQLGSGDLAGLVSDRMASNTVFKNTLPYIVDNSRGTASGYGKGELFFMVYGKNAVKLESKEHADVSVDGWKVEIKGKGAALNPGNDDGKTQSVNIVDGLNQELMRVATELNLSLPQRSEKQNPTNPVSGWFPKFFKQLAAVKGNAVAKQTLNSYLKRLYRMEDQLSSKMTAEVYPLLGDREVNRTWSKFVINKAKGQSKWQSTIVIDTDAAGAGFPYVNIVDGNDLPSNLVLKPVLSKGKGTYAYPDGALMVSINDRDEFNKNAVDQYTNQVVDLKTKFAQYSTNNAISKTDIASVGKKIVVMQTEFDKRLKSGRWNASSGLIKSIGTVQQMLDLLAAGQTIRKKSSRSKSVARQPVPRQPKPVRPAGAQIAKQKTSPVKNYNVPASGNLNKFFIRDQYLPIAQRLGGAAKFQEYLKGKTIEQFAKENGLPLN
jgi:hypothetical protein